MSTMEAWVIALTDEEAAPAMESAEKHFPGIALQWDATTPDEAEQYVSGFGIPWNHPKTGHQVIEGLRFHAYSGDWRKRFACFWSHYDLWGECVLEDEPRLILESDAVFTRRFDPEELIGCQFGIVSLNDPRGATRKAGWYGDFLHECRTRNLPFAEAPWVDTDNTIPQGLPGMSAYVIWPWFAQELLDKVEQVGAMPNDALVNRQWFPGKLGCITNYATKVSGRPSTLA